MIRRTLKNVEEVVLTQDTCGRVRAIAVTFNGDTMAGLTEEFAAFRNFRIQADHILGPDGTTLATVAGIDEGGERTVRELATLEDAQAVPDRATINSLPDGIRNYIRRLERGK